MANTMRYGTEHAENAFRRFSSYYFSLTINDGVGINELRFFLSILDGAYIVKSNRKSILHWLFGQRKVFDRK